MARFLALSDVHIEFGDLRVPKLERLGHIDAVLLAGDIMPWTNCVRWADGVAKHYGVPAVLIPGNHEFYARVHPDRTIDKTIAACRQVAAATEGRVIFLDDEETTIAGVRILGATLWTDFCLHGVADQASAIMAADIGMNDFLICWEKEGVPFSARASIGRHEKSVRWLRERFQDKTAPTIVMTHHLPSARSIADQFRGGMLSPAYASNLDDLVEQSGAKVWMHGHTHHEFDYVIGKTRMLCNPRGYFGHELNPDFKPDLVIEI